MKHSKIYTIAGVTLTAALALWASACSSASFGGSTGAAGLSSANASGSGSGVGTGSGPGSNSNTAAGSGSDSTPGISSSSSGTGSSPAITSSASTCGNSAAAIDWTGAQKTCIVDQGKTWDFDTNTCVLMPQATFACNWTNALAQLSGKGITDPVLNADQKAGALLVSCGESADGTRLVVQWINVADGAGGVSCTNGSLGSHHVTTGCYTYYPNGNPPPVPTDPAALAAYVGQCLNTL